MPSILPDRGKVKVLFHNGEGPEGKQPIQASLNGTAMLIPRNTEVILDVKWLHGVFASAATTEYDRGGDGRGLERPRLVPRYSYELIEVVEDAKAQAEAKVETEAKGEATVKAGK